MNFDLLKTFQIVARCESITRASEQLFISPPAVSKCIKKLEAELGCSLFDRQNHRIQLNEHGKLVLQACDDIFARYTLMLENLAENAGLDRPLRLSSSIPALIRYILPVYCRENNTFVDCRHIALEDVRTELLSQYAEAVFSNRPLYETGVGILAFCSAHCMVSVPHSSPLFGKTQVSLKDLDNQPLLLSSSVNNIKPSTLVSRAIRYMDKNGIKPLYYAANDLELYHSLQQGHKFLSLTTSIVAYYLDKHDPQVQFLPVSDGGLKEVYYILYLEKNFERIRPLYEWIKSYSGRLFGPDNDP